jgi:hypothetical protein
VLTIIRFQINNPRRVNSFSSYSTITPNVWRVSPILDQELGEPIDNRNNPWERVQVLPLKQAFLVFNQFAEDRQGDQIAKMAVLTKIDLLGYFVWLKERKVPEANVLVSTGGFVKTILTNRGNIEAVELPECGARIPTATKIRTQSFCMFTAVLPRRIA